MAFRLFGSTRSEPSSAYRMAMIERKLDAIMQQLGIELPADDFEEVRVLACSGRKIEAIKLYRTQTGSSLSDAKAFVDSL